MPDTALVAVIEPIETLTKRPRTYGLWFVQEAYHREKWEALGLDVTQRDETPIAIDLGAGPVNVRRDISKLTIGPDGGYPVAVDATADFPALPEFPALTEIVYEGGDAGLVGYLERQAVQNLTWSSHAQTHIDLSGSLLSRLTIEVTEPLRLRVPPQLDWLIVDGDASLLTVENVDARWPFELTVRHSLITSPPAGLETVQSLTLDRLVESDTAGLTGYTDLRSLTLRGAPGRLTDVAGVVEQASLRELWVFDLYGLDGGSWQREDGWPMLDDVLITGLHKDDARSIKAALVTVPRVKISGSRSDAWIAANLDNPLRDWDNDGAAFGKAARNAWKKAKIATQKLGVVGAAPEAMAALEAFVVALNRLADKYDIDTMRREEAFEAYLGLAGDFGVTVDEASEAFDQWRNF